ncbi:hypothetical protein [Kosmotoga sp. DU53]|uniref:hypothetical protein n=1 Tax=Kosmotoga sp. DU53 TaxID=1310160 RepID=UPI0007C53CA0|nr:hypothetical protein [Kosmotoga sp. DU53]OAA24063.1 hypothetical protein DU53_01380 [Kosmotoga sp. DU53]
MKKRTKTELFTLVFVIIALLFMMVYSSKYRIAVYVPNDSVELDEFYPGKGFEIVDTNELCPISGWDCRGFVVTDASHHRYLVFFWKLDNKEKARELWEELWKERFEVLAKNRGRIVKPSYAFGKVVRFGVKDLSWQKGCWVFFVETDEGVIPEGKESEFMKKFIPEQFLNDQAAPH